MDVKIFPKTMRSAFAIGFVACALGACAPNNGVGFAEFGTVTGRIVDAPSLQPIAGATIAIGNIVSVTAAIDQGGFVLRNVPVGTQTLTISATGWQSYRTQVTVAANQAADIGVIGLPSALAR
jgi:hypothetical protein